MLERATRCLNHRGTSLCTNSSNPVHTRRRLHSAFWRHGAGDLDLPAWYWSTMTALFEPHHSNDHDNTKTSTPSHQPPAPFLLDFLYTKRTRSYLRRISAAAATSSFSTSTRHDQTSKPIRKAAPSPSTINPTSTVTSNAKPAHRVKKKPARIPNTTQPLVHELDTTQDDAPALEELISYLEKHQQGEYQDVWPRAWQLYCGLSPGQRSVAIMTGMLDFLAASPRVLDADRIIRMWRDWHKLFPTSITPAVSLLVVKTSIKLERIGRAYSVGLQAMEQHGEALTTDIYNELLPSLINARMWQMAFRIWSTRNAHRQLTDGSDDARKSSHEVASCTGKVQQFPTKVRQLLDSLRQNPDMASAKVTDGLVMQLVETVYQRGKSFGPQHDIGTLRKLHSMNRLTPEILEAALLTQLGPIKSTPLQVREAFKIYNFIGSLQQLVRTQSRTIKPTRRTLRSLLKRATDVKDVQAVHILFHDWSKYAGTPLLRDTALFMKFFAGQGDVARTDHAFQQYMKEYHDTTKSRHANRQANQDGSVDDVMKLFYPLLHVRALRADAEGVQQQLDKMVTDYSGLGLQPDVSCYNILMHAYQRNDDLDGCLDCMSQILQNNLTPDHYTFGTLMSVAADRGDLEMIDELQSAAKDLGIPTSQVMHDCHVLALLNNEKPLAARVYAIRVLDERGPRDQTRTWNQILAYYALNSAAPRIRKQTLSIARLVQGKGIPFNSFTFAAIIRAYVTSRKAPLGLRIIKKSMIPRNVPVYPFHYALVINGLAEQNLFTVALKVHADMLQSGIKPDYNTRLALLNLQTKAALSKAAVNFAPRIGKALRLDVTEELMEETSADDPDFLISKNPRLASKAFSLLDAQHGAAFHYMMSTYTNVQAFDTVSMLLDRYTKTVSSSNSGESKTLPLRLLIPAMRVSYQAHNYTQVLQYWDLALATASRTTAPVSQLQDQNSTDTTPTTPPRRTPSARTILARHIDILLRTLATTKRIDTVPSLITSLRSRSFDLDNTNWNLYVSLLAAYDHPLQAFTLAESHLTPAFAGWRPDKKALRIQTIGKRSPGLEFQAPRHTFLKRGELRLTFGTAVRLAKSVEVLRQKAPFKLQAGRVLERLKREAPRTWSAVVDLRGEFVAKIPRARRLLGSGSRLLGEGREGA